MHYACACTTIRDTLDAPYVAGVRDSTATAATVSVSLPRPLLDWLRERARTESRTVSGMMQVILSAYREAVQPSK
jgi:hypothetical protein